LDTISNETVEIHSIYDALDKSKLDPTQTPNCTVGENYNANVNCTLTFTVPEDMTPPIMVYYELDNFHQNHRFYYRSKDEFQLNGAVNERLPVAVANCEPLHYLGNATDGKTLNPCGLVANTFFNDKFDLVDSYDKDGDPLVMKEEGIAWQSDLQYRYSMPDGFQMKNCAMDQCLNTTTSTCCQDYEFSCDVPAIHPKDGLCYAYDYPKADETQYLYQSYPNLINPLEHVTNEHFIVWMRIATRPKFRKLYGWINQNIPKGTVLKFNVNSNYVVESFGGHKALIITETNMFGGKNEDLGVTMYGFGYIFLAMGIFLAIKHWFRPRKIADRKYLQYKED
jgi:hypothetical protein